MGMVRYPSYLADITEDCWRRAGVTAGMRVLDAGCGAGDSTLLTARMVGPTGTVVGLERDHSLIRIARTVADERSVENVEFREGEFASLAWFGEAPFDAVVGRGFLAHQGDPALALRELARLVRPGGVIAFLEEELDYGHRMEPTTPVVSQAVDRIQGVAREQGRQLHVVSTFSRMFLEAGLGWPSVRAYQAAWGPAAGIWEHLAAQLAGVTMPPTVDAARLAKELHEAVCGNGGAWVSPPTAGAWARVAG